MPKAEFEPAPSAPLNNLFQLNLLDFKRCQNVKLLLQVPFAEQQNSPSYRYKVEPIIV
jgi:hypothetical protein